MTRKAKPTSAIVGVSDHGGWAVLMTVTRRGALVDRRRVDLVDDELPRLPHHHDGQMLPLQEAVALVARVQASAVRCARKRLDELAAAVPNEIVGIALRACPSLPETVAERITNYRAMCVADWVMYRQALGDAATARGWSVHWYDSKRVFADAASALKLPTIDALLDETRAAVGAPWQKDHKLAVAAAIAAAGTA
jgi:hypothetical protein